ncbi:caspase-8 [Melanotaenia boesemani]|uniref:caspase-8 n=1 Tax=Melanotaenia boesemani TaxID=1250792 RepID=UPI001C051E10|nr:caspase-8 [Melanotaenia boesemani]
MEVDFQKLLLDVDKALSSREIKALGFLCTDLLNRDMTSVESASKLFKHLMDHDLLSPEEPQLLMELLLTIQHQRLLRNLSLADKACSTKSLIAPYRKLLYTLSEEITTKMLSDIKFMLNNELPRRKLEDNVTALEVFRELERMDLINEANLNKLEDIFKIVCPVLNEKIKNFMAQQAQEKNHATSSSDPFNLNQVSKSLPGTGVQVKKERNDVEERVPSQESTTSSVTEIKTQGLEAYPMTAAKRGVCMIVNNYIFTSLAKREGTKVDQKSLEKVFKWLGFKVELHNDCDRKKMLSVFHELSRRDHSQMDCLVCFVLSHGQEGGVHGVDGLIVRLEELMDPFVGLKCPSLVEKPKLFFIQACQGNNTQKPVEADGPELSNICCDAKADKKSIPSDADFLLGMATVPSCVSFRERSNGTWYIQSLCKNLVQLVPSGCDLVSILTKVNADVSRKTHPTGEKKQMPQPTFTLRKNVVFPIPKTPAPSLR